MASFALVLQASGCEHPDGEPHDFISAHTGVIRCSCDEDGRTTTAAKVQAYRVHADLAAQAGESLFDVCDAHSQHLHEVYAALLDPKTDELKDDFLARVDGADSGVLVLDYVLLAPQWRGLRQGYWRRGR